MQKPPEVRIRSGSPTQDELEAVRLAVLNLCRADLAEAARGSGVSPWVLAARMAGTGSGLEAARGRASGGGWALSGRLGSHSRTHRPAPPAAAP